MDPIEKAIRNAFSKGDAGDPAFREKVYRSAFSALDRALQANPAITVEAAINRRKAMQARIGEIEAEFSAAAPALVAQANAPVPSVQPPSAGSMSEPAVPIVAAPPRQEPLMERARVEPSVSPPAQARVPDFVPGPVLAGSPAAEPPLPPRGGMEVLPDRDERRAARRRLPYRAFLSGLLLLAVIGGGLWWAAKDGLLTLPPGQDTASSRQQGDAQSGETPVPAKPGDPDQGRDWTTVFTPSDPTLVSAPSDATAEVKQDDTGSFLRIRSGTSGSTISFDVGQGVLQKLSGKHVVFDVLARAEEGQQVQMSIDCNFGDFGDCGRRRFAVGQERNEYLFDVQFPDKQPGSSGTIAVDTDIDRQGRAVDIYEIRVSIAE